jgi:hypothetical protein
MPAPPSAASPRLDLGRLPIAGPLRIGRETELARLDAAWEDPGIHVLTLVAFGGVPRLAAPGKEAAADFAKAAEHLDHAVGVSRTSRNVSRAFGNTRICSSPGSL